ncbi:mechanosensitive ion channel family protein [Parvularcula dongshanensis]|uniref:Small-conductance mechanosensitive channel n=1 Tax=Parvularcula dongshanensis TaxID=1173995 RepID=A0A840HZY4_9PROT|nr:mechanosensitive ion channel family protein [Parvularcula dongshanensis]MBB4657987.1 small-conductance mechanosensitive channel [Parvularcula dongshanensis]
MQQDQSQAPSPAQTPPAPPADGADPNGILPGNTPVEAEGFVPLLLDRLVSMYESFVRLLPLLVVGLIVLILTWALAAGLSRLARKATRRAGTRRSLSDLAATLTRVMIWVLGLLTTATIVFPSLDPAAILSGLGIGGIIIGIAFQDTFQNFMAGVLIMLRRSMRVGDYLDSEGVEGRIEEINLRDTYLRKTDGELVIVPNKHLFENPVTVWTDPDFRRYEIVVGVAYDEDVDQARSVIEQAIGGLDLGKSPKQPQVFAKEFGASSIDFTVRWWADPEPVGFHKSRDLVVAAIKRALDEAGIEIPFPYRTLTFKEPLRLGRLTPDERDEQKDGL